MFFKTTITAEDALREDLSGLGVDIISDAFPTCRRLSWWRAPRSGSWHYYRLADCSHLSKTLMVKTSPVWEFIWFFIDQLPAHLSKTLLVKPSVVWKFLLLSTSRLLTCRGGYWWRPPRLGSWHYYPQDACPTCRRRSWWRAPRSGSWHYYRLDACPTSRRLSWWRAPRSGSWY
jgi:hypothetical protein